MLQMGEFDRFLGCGEMVFEFYPSPIGGRPGVPFADVACEGLRICGGD